LRLVAFRSRLRGVKKSGFCPLMCIDLLKYSRKDPPEGHVTHPVTIKSFDFKALQERAYFLGNP